MVVVVSFIEAFLSISMALSCQEIHETTSAEKIRIIFILVPVFSESGVNTEFFVDGAYPQIIAMHRCASPSYRVPQYLGEQSQ